MEDPSMIAEQVPFPTLSRDTGAQTRRAPGPPPPNLPPKAAETPSHSVLHAFLACRVLLLCGKDEYKKGELGELGERGGDPALDQPASQARPVSPTECRRTPRAVFPSLSISSHLRSSPLVSPGLISPRLVTPRLTSSPLPSPHPMNPRLPSPPLPAPAHPVPRPVARHLPPARPVSRRGTRVAAPPAIRSPHPEPPRSGAVPENVPCIAGGRAPGARDGKRPPPTPHPRERDGPARGHFSLYYRIAHRGTARASSSMESQRHTTQASREEFGARGRTRPACVASWAEPTCTRPSWHGSGTAESRRQSRLQQSRDGRLGDGIEAKAAQEKREGRGGRRVSSHRFLVVREAGEAGIPHVGTVHAMRLRVVSMLRDGEVAVRGAGGPSQRVPGVMAARSQVAGRRLHKDGLSRCEPEVDVGNTTDEADPAMGQRVPTPSATPRHTPIRGKRPADEDWQSLP
ncbi:hypothetical protein JHW43_003108 [Diplocarpon mali]|nr:hypothetical protein JHW43_003108 [Diplocarpon mali]